MISWAKCSFFILFFFAVSSAAHAVMFHINAQYADGTTFQATYDDPDGDGECPIVCSLTAASVSFGTELQAAVDANATVLNQFAIEPGNLVPYSLGLEVLAIGASPSWIVRFQTNDPVVSAPPGDYLHFTDGFAELNDLYCFVHSGSGGRVCGAFTSLNTAVLAVQTTISAAATIPEPTTVALFGFSLLIFLAMRSHRLAIINSRNRSA